MRKFLLGTASVIAIAGLAGAADSQTGGNGASVNWSGPYLGVEGGYGWGSTSDSDSTGFNSGSFRANGGALAGIVLTRVDLRQHATYGYGDLGYFYGHYGNYYSSDSES